MFKPRPCGCKGIRTCLICEAEFGVNAPIDAGSNANQEVYEYCYKCERAWEGNDVSSKHPIHNGQSYPFPGVLVVPDFITAEEEKDLVKGCDSIPWDLSQSGRRKQNFGPKTNFKKRKMNGNSFNGFPAFSKLVQEKLRGENLLSDFQTIEQCAIEYRVDTGACIDPHIDDCWVWGERVISVNLLSDSVLTMTKFRGPKEKYNLHYYSGGTVDGDSPVHDPGHDLYFPIVRIPMPRLSLLVLYGPARYAWEHCIYRSDITDRRICMAYREFTPEYLKGGKSYDPVGQDVIARAQLFW